MILYHGTFASDTESLKPSDGGFFGAGVYLSSSSEDAAQYGDRLALVSLDVVRPFYTKADYAVAQDEDCDTPAGRMVLDVLGAAEGRDRLLRLRESTDGYLDATWSETLQALGHDCICATWPDGLQHWVVFDPQCVQVVRWIDADYAAHEASYRTWIGPT